MDDAREQIALLEEILERLERLENQQRDSATRKLDLGQFAIDLRRSRADLFPDEYCKGNIWDVLLELYDAKRSGEKLRLTDISARTKTPEKLTLRYVDLLSADGFLYNEQSMQGGNQPHILMTDKALNQIDQLFEHIQMKNSERGDLPEAADRPADVARRSAANEF
ncbi:hypothetical protein [Parasphingorhabdus cellanae]|uniref:MarR family transcriptional regulator n=1 Tax=Parasphingorhabdus cellanae TaxID=2806553 RepID=A0ABX7T7P9_9SPHN|nr:hypothetical protein [Parasphingorhabdus cellanae]QTD57526.1 hypothetical protein J4G78_08410 [Parasphingorhabdus cellanae]